jgi:hypothetical protein
MKIGVRLAGQGKGLAACLRALLPDTEVVVFPAPQGLTPAEQAAQATALAACDHILADHAGAAQDTLAALAQSGKPLHRLPLFHFGGFHPDVTSVTVQGRALPSPTGLYHSRIAVIGFLARLPLPETETLFNPLIFSRLGYLGAYALACRMLAERWGQDGVDAAPLLENWRKTGCFAHTPNHPKIGVLLDLAHIACARMGLTPTGTAIDVTRLPDALGRGALHPVFPAIAAAIGVAPEGCFSPGLDDFDDRVVLSLPEVLHGCFARYERVSQSDLLAVPGVVDGMAALGLSVAAPAPARTIPGRGAQRARLAGAGLRLMTYHGTLLRQGALPGQLLHRSLTAPGQDLPFVTVECGAKPVMQETGALGGALVREGYSPPLVTVSRGPDFLCAERDNERAAFSRQQASTWERFLPLSEAEVTVLQRIVASDWFLGATGERIPRAMIRPADQYSLQFGRWRIDLTKEFPRLAGDGEEARLTLRLDGAVCELMPMAELAEPPPAPAELLIAGRQLVLAGAEAWLPPPVTAGDAGRAWLYEAARDPAMLDGRPKPCAAALRRAHDKALGEGTPQGRIPGVTVRFLEAGDGPGGFAIAALRLHVLSAAAPAEATYLLAADTPDAFVPGFAALGFGGLRFVRLPVAPVVAADLIWLDQPDVAGLPAEALAGLRARTGMRPPGARKLFWAKGIAAPAAEALKAAGFEAVPAGLPPLALIGLLLQAGWLAGASGQLTVLFSPPGVRVVELCGREGFDGTDWMVSAKLGLMHGVLPCRAVPDGLAPDAGELSTLLRVMAFRSEK